MKAHNRKGGYSAITANEYIDNKQAIFCLSTELEPQIKFENGQPTGEIIAYKAWFSQKDSHLSKLNLNQMFHSPHTWIWSNLICLKPVRSTTMYIFEHKTSRRSNNE